MSLLTLCSGFSESTLLLSLKVLWRWASGVGGRHKMIWEPLATDLHIGSQGRMVVFLHIEARVGSGSHLGDGAALSRDSTAPPHGGRV